MRSHDDVVAGYMRIGVVPKPGLKAIPLVQKIGRLLDLNLIIGLFVEQ